jgi:hypothetical protein
MLYGQVSVAHEWGKRPSELGICSPEDDVALMAAYTRTRQLMQAIESQETADKIEEAKD